MRKDVAEQLRRLKQEPGKGLWPRVVEHMGGDTLTLSDTKTFTSGVVALHYRAQ